MTEGENTKIRQEGHKFYFVDGGGAILSPSWVKDQDRCYKMWFVQDYCKLNDITPEFVDAFPPKFKWTVEIEVDEAWISAASPMIPDLLAKRIEFFLESGEVGAVTAKIIDAPDPEDIERARGKS